VHDCVIFHWNFPLKFVPLCFVQWPFRILRFGIIEAMTAMSFLRTQQQGRGALASHTIALLTLGGRWTRVLAKGVIDMTGHPAMALPPIDGALASLQLVSRKGGDALLCALAPRLEPVSSRSQDGDRT
jgi:hypothetical protein